jgi:DNA-3-methyladenine glycosylase
VTAESSSSEAPDGRVLRGAPGSLAERFDRPLGRPFFDRPTRRVARGLLGQILVRRSEGKISAARLVETEAYLTGDPASHAFHGPTRRNASMFGRPGTLYVFRIHQVVCANVVTGRGEAVLLRAGSPIYPNEGNPSGPGRLCRYLGVTLSEDGSDLVSSETRVLAGVPPIGKVRTSPRVGISKARERRLRYYLEGDPWVSPPRPWARGRA